MGLSSIDFSGISCLGLNGKIPVVLNPFTTLVIVIPLDHAFANISLN